MKKTETRGSIQVTNQGDQFTVKAPSAYMRARGGALLRRICEGGENPTIADYMRSGESYTGAVACALRADYVQWKGAQI